MLSLPVSHLLFPSSCLFCQAMLEGADTGFCVACLDKIRPLSLDICSVCGVPMPKELVPGPCGQCLQDRPAQIATHSLYIYQGVVRDVVLSWKLQGQDAGVLWLLDVAVKRLRELISPNDLLLPVPMPLSRMRKQGQHHAANLCRHIANHVGCDWDWKVLRRIGNQQRQSALSGAQRQKNLRKAFVVDTDYWYQRESVAGRIWVIDDIITTGMTVHFASKALGSIGNEIHVLSLTRTVKGG